MCVVIRNVIFSARSLSFIRHWCIIPVIIHRDGQIQAAEGLYPSARPLQLGHPQAQESVQLDDEPAGAAQEGCPLIRQVL